MGYRDLLDNELLKSYSAAGVIHILSVSGLHVGLLVLVAMWFLNLLAIPEKFQWVKYLLVIVLVWAFACITGLSPPILRAAVAGSFILTGKMLRRDMHPLNGLAASAFFLFIINPFWLFDIGFELSYVAVAGIILLYPAFYRLLYIPWRAVDWLWQSAALSLAATIATLPLTLYYFHQAPVYFILSNLIVIPLSSLIMLAGALLLVLSPFHWLAVFVAKFVWWLVNIMDGCINFIGQLPMSRIKDIAILKEEAVLLGVVIVFFVLFVQLQKSPLLIVSLFVFSGLIVSGIPLQKGNFHQGQVVVYSVNKHTAIDLVDGPDDVILCDEALLADERAWMQHIVPARIYMGLGDPIFECLNEDTSKFQWKGIWRDGNFIQFHRKRMMVITSWKRKVSPIEKLKIDYLVLSGDAKVNLYELGISSRT